MIKYLDHRLYTRKDPHNCPICDPGQTDKARLDELLRRSAMATEALPLVLQTEINKLQHSQARYERHLAQFRVQRENAKKIENTLQTGQGVLYRDFVSSYNCNGKR